MAECAAADAVKTGAGATNRHGVWARQNHFITFLDRNNASTFGTFAFYLCASQTFDPTAQFDDFALLNLTYVWP